ncbi:MAG: ABC transporter permease [Desulfovibrionaceae bacterium]|nr:ABC transporter permease [Desulfovibrionaceae bacterium]
MGLVILSVVFSTMLLLGIEKARTQIKENFIQALSGTDLVVGSKTGEIQLILFSIFHLGELPASIDYSSAEALIQNKDVAWTIPLSMGDSHRGYPVVATNESFYDHYQYSLGKKIALVSGKAPEGLFDVCLGSEVARNLGYNLGTKIVLSHGLDSNKDDPTTINYSSHAEKELNDPGHAASHEAGEHGHGGHHAHDQFPFTVTGILAPTGTPIDRSIYVQLGAIEAIHIGWVSGVQVSDIKVTAKDLDRFDLHPKKLTCVLVGLKHKHLIFRVKQEIEATKDEPLIATIPSVVMDEIWRMIGTSERILLLISAFVTMTGLASLAAVILAGLGERRRELAILRSVGARPLDILTLLLSEGLLLVLTGVILGTLILYALIGILAPALVDKYGILFHLDFPTVNEWYFILGICIAGCLASLIPAIRAYKFSLSDGLNVTV